MNDTNQSKKDEGTSFGKSDSFEHMIAMQEQIFNPPLQDEEEQKVTDFSSFGGGNTTAVNDLSAHDNIKAPDESAKKVEEEPEEIVDSRSEEEMHSLFSDPSAGTVQDVSEEEKQKLAEERQADELAKKEEERRADEEYKAAENGEPVTAPESLFSASAPKEEEKSEEHHEESKEEPKEESHEEAKSEEHHVDLKPISEHHEEEHHEEKHDEPKEEHHEEESHEDEHHDEAPEEPKEEEHHEEEHHDEPEEHHEEESHEDEHHDEAPEEPKEEEHEEVPAAAVWEKNESPDDMKSTIKDRLTAMRTERNIMIVEIDKLEDALLEEGSDAEHIKDELRAKHEELHRKKQAIAGLIELLHIL